MNNVQHKVLLPEWIFKQAEGNHTEIKRLVLDYMKRCYPNYILIKVSGSFAFCDRLESLL